MSIIMIRGFSHSGKDYIGNLLCKNYKYVRFAFADSLKKIVAENFNCSLNKLHSQEGKLEICEKDSMKRTYRQILIDEALRLRNLDENIFVNRCCQDIISSGANNIVITDWRYPNEIDIITKIFPYHKIVPICVKRLNQIKSPVDDISEYHLTSRESDYILQNNMDDTINYEIEKLINYIKGL